MGDKDPWFNAFNATVAAFAAGIGGAEAITVVRFLSQMKFPEENRKGVWHETPNFY